MINQRLKKSTIFIIICSKGGGNCSLNSELGSGLSLLCFFVGWGGTKAGKGKNHPERLPGLQWLHHLG